ncbi:unnamed protein product, partial [Adineta steineri]
YIVYVKMQQDPLKISPIKAVHDLARRNKITAEYQLEKETGPAHAKIYTIRLRFGEKEYIGIDRSIKLAQRSAAQTALNEHKHLSTSDNLIQKTNISQSPAVILNTWAARHHVPTQYILLNEQYLTPPMNSSWSRPRVMFFYRLYFGQDIYFDGHGLSHQEARMNCAHQALRFINQNQMPLIISMPSQAQEKSQISLMYERAKQLGLSVQIVHEDPLKVTYRVGEQYSTVGTGQTKHEAKQIAAEKMLEILPIPIDKSQPKTKQKSARNHSNQHKKFIEQKGSNNYSLSEEINPITRLYQIGQARDIKIEFIQLEYSLNDKQFHFQVRFGENDFADGYGKNKQAAKRIAAENLLTKLNPDIYGSINITLPPPPIKGLLKRDENSHKQHQQEKKHVHFLEEQINEHVKTDFNHQSTITIKQQLINACQKLNIHIQYDDQLITNDENQYQSILSLSKDNRLLAQFRGHGLSLIRAQENVSTIAWKTLRQLFKSLI